MHVKKKILFYRLGALVCILLFILTAALYVLARKEIAQLDRWISSTKNAHGTKKHEQNISTVRRELVDENSVFYDHLVQFLEQAKKEKNDLWAKAETLWFEARNACYFSSSASILVTEKGEFIICESFVSSMLALYSRKGKLIRTFGKEGKGPGEYKDPTHIAAIGDTLICFDNAQNKVILFRISNGAFLREYHLDFLYDKDFAAAQDKNRIYLIFYEIPPFVYDHIISIYTIHRRTEMLSKRHRYGRIDNSSQISSIFKIKGLDLIENKYIAFLEPQKFGFHLMTIKGEWIGSFFDGKPPFFVELGHVRPQDLRDQMQSSRLYFKHSRCYTINYLGKGILGISVENPFNKARGRFDYYLTLWTVDGSYLGYLQIDHKVCFGKDGKIYRWIEEDVLSNQIDDKLKNPPLLIMNLWDAANTGMAHAGRCGGREKLKHL